MTPVTTPIAEFITYSNVLVEVTLQDYPGVAAVSNPFTFTIRNPCWAATFTDPNVYSAMTTTVLRGTVES